MTKNNNIHQKKHFNEWNKVKKNINRRAKVPTIHEGEVWWFADGQNVGVEIDGKGERFARPIVILTKFGKLSFFGIPLTSKKHDGSWYAEYDFNGKTQYAALCQARTISVNRLYRKMGEMTKSDLQRVRDGFLALHDKKYPSSSDEGIVGVPKDTSIISRLRNYFKTIFKHFSKTTKTTDPRKNH